jgi:uncharacterized protein (TIGR02145 family)
LYNWYAISDTRLLEPAGWHIPTDVEWTMLEKYLGEQVGKKIKSTEGWTINGNGTNESGFSAFPGGSREYNGSFEGYSKYGLWWSSTEHSSGLAWFRALDYMTDGLPRDYYAKQKGLYVRCIKD